ncbi:MAG: hypothetical protein U0871_11260 [Gemmataceae bacterium]
MRRFLRRKWVRRLLAATGLVVVLVLAARPIADFLMRDRLAAFIDKIEADDPDWRLDRLAAARNAALPPDDRNSFPIVTAAAGKLPPTFGGEFSPLLMAVEKRPSTLLRSAACTALDSLLTKCGPALADARRLATMPDGGQSLIFPDSPRSATFISPGYFRQVCHLLQLDAYAAANANRPGDAVQSLRAILNVGRAVGDEPSFVSQLQRATIAFVAARAVEFVIALCEPTDTDGLAELQAELLREADFRRLTVGFRGERALSFQQFEWMKANGVVASTGNARIDPLARWGMQAHLPADQLRTLELMTELVIAANKPFDQQKAAMVAVQRPDANDWRFYLTRLSLDFVDMFTDGGLKCRSHLLSVAAGVAAERYRRKHGAWPASLEALVPEFLPAVPTEPFSGKPLGFERLPDGLAITPTGPDGQRDLDHGMRLWDPDKRRKPPSEGKP